ncbi:hypothetical protein RDI58_000975 [Solanum bulbocastanum]|uniref:Uncharacterized protein n=1 Tax=Solanum bulbocastanum TaxID=147425 RepID=A0AAN8YPQ4_SOLBU
MLIGGGIALSLSQNVTSTKLQPASSDNYPRSLATQFRKQLHASRKKGELVEGFNFSIETLITRYLEANADVPFDPSTLLPNI